MLGAPFLYSELSAGAPNAWTGGDATTSHDLHSTDVQSSNANVVDTICVRQAVVFPPSIMVQSLDERVLRTLEPLLRLADPDEAGTLVSPLGYDLDIGDRPACRSVLLEPRAAPGKRLSARGLLVSYLYNSSDADAGSAAWNDVVRELAGEDSGGNGFNGDNDNDKNYRYTVDVGSQDGAIMRPFVHFNLFPNFPSMLFAAVILLSVGSVALLFALTDPDTVRSRAGLMLAFITQGVLALLASATIVSSLYKCFTADVIRQFLIIPLIMFVSSSENTFRLVDRVGRTSPDATPAVRLAEVLEATTATSVKFVALNAALFGVAWLPLWGLADEVRALCLFAMLGLAFDLVLHLTYFVAVMFIDLKRLELQELLMMDPVEQLHKPMSRGYRARFLQFVVNYRSIMFVKNKFPFATTSMALLFFRLVWASAGLFDSLPRRRPFFVGPILDRLDVHASRYDVYEPIVLVSKASFDGLYSKGPNGLGAANLFSGYSLHLIIELAAFTVFILCVTLLTLRALLPESERSKSTDGTFEDGSRFFSKDLVGYHFLDVVQIAVHKSWIATLSLDHKVYLWNAAGVFSKAYANEPVYLPLSQDVWPISKVVVNANQQLVAVFCARLSLVELWNFGEEPAPVLVAAFSDPTVLVGLPAEAFFSGGDLTMISRAGFLIVLSATGAESVSRITINSEASDADKTTKRNSQGLPTVTSPRKQWLEPPATGSRPNGTIRGEPSTSGIDTMGSADGKSIGAAASTPVRVKIAKRLFTPKVCEQVVLVTPENHVVVGVHVARGAWLFRRVDLVEALSVVPRAERTANPTECDSFAYSSADIAPAATLGAPDPLRLQPLPRTRPYMLHEKVLMVVPLSELNIVVLATELAASLLDVQSNAVLRHFHVGAWQPESIRAFHSVPTYCRFCGCTSVASLSVAYNDAENPGLVICHTLQIENRAKNNICLRIERNPLETRCLGLDAATERQHWIDRVEGWETTGINMLMGVRRKELQFDGDRDSNSPLSDDGGGEGGRSSFSGSSRSPSPYHGISRSPSQSRGRRDVEGPRLRIVRSSSMSSGGGSSSQARASLRKHQKKPPLNITWEGWAMSANGEVSYYDIPDVAGDPGSFSIPTIADPRHDAAISPSSRLLIKSIGPVAKYGRKSICVAFGNIIKVLYFGNEEIHDEADDAVPTVQQTGGISAPNFSGARKWRRSALH